MADCPQVIWRIDVFEDRFWKAADVVKAKIGSCRGKNGCVMQGPAERPTAYRTTQIDGLSIFYRESGPLDAPTLLLLHGLPSSSRMFEPLFARLSDRYHLIAPDPPGFGHSDWPNSKRFAYTFGHYADIMGRFTEALGLSRYMQDYGGPDRTAPSHGKKAPGNTRGRFITRRHNYAAASNLRAW